MNGEQPETTAVVKAGVEVVQDMRSGNIPFDSFQRLARMIAESGMFQDSRQLAQAGVKILAGAEMGFGPIAAMTGIYVVKGHVMVGANILAQCVRKAGYDYRVRTLTNEECKIEFFAVTDGKRESLGVSTYTLADAKKANLDKPDSGWEKNPRNMVFARAMSNGVKWYVPDAVHITAYTPEEEADIPEPRPPIEDEWKQPGSREAQLEKQNATLSALRAKRNEAVLGGRAEPEDQTIPTLTRASFTTDELALLVDWIPEAFSLAKTPEALDDWLAHWEDSKEALLKEALKWRKKQRATEKKSKAEDLGVSEKDLQPVNQSDLPYPD